MTLERTKPRLMPPDPVAGGEIANWMLDPDCDFLNHGSFGARPRDVDRAQTRWRDELNARPVDFLDRRWYGLLEEVRQHLGSFLGTAPEGLGLVTNATGAVNSVLRSLRFEPGDEVLTTNHVYNAVRNTMRHIIERAGGRYVEAAVPFPIASSEQVTEAIEKHISSRTRLVLVDHVTSPSALVMPVMRIAELCRNRGVELMIDGAHAPGMLDLDVESIGATYYTGNLHKWVCAPLGAAFLWVSPERREDIHPNTISHFLGQGYAREFAWQGTRDVTPWLCVPEAIRWMDTLGWASVRDHNHRLATWVQSRLAEQWDVEPTTPGDGSLLGSMTALPIPPGLGHFPDATALRDELYHRHRIEVPVFEWNERWWIRMSCQVYNRPEQYERLGETILGLARPN